MSRSEMWSLLQTVADSIAVLSAQVDFVSDMVSSRNKAMQEHSAWGVKNTRILSTRVPNEIAKRWDEIMLCENLSTSSVLRVLAEDFVDEYNPTEKSLFYVPRIPLYKSLIQTEGSQTETPAESQQEQFDTCL